MEALRLCEAKDRDFNALFQRQYFLSEERGLCPEGWQSRKLGEWYLYHCPDLPLAELKDADGKKVGFLLGVAVARDGGLFPGGRKLSRKAGSRVFWDDVEAEIEGLAGRYVVIVTNFREMRVYFDPVCDLAAVFDPECRVVASSLFLCLHRPLRRNRRMDHRGPLRQQHNFALQHTPDRFVKRVMANHYLDLRTFCLVRHYPHGDENFETTEAELEDSMARIVTRLRQIMAALLNNYACVIPVTGGNDSRNLIACCGDNIGLARRLFTFHMNKMSGFDCMIAQEIAADLGAELDIIDVLAQADHPLFEKQAMHRKRWDLAYATGYSWPGTSPETIVAAELVPEADLLIRGNVMELMRANQYLPGDWYSFSIEQALRKLRVAPQIDETQVAIWEPEYMMWADSLPRNATARIYDFAFAELLLPNTMGGMLIAPAPQFYMNAFSDRELMRLALSMDPKVRRENKMNTMLVEMAHPSLNRIERTGRFKKNPDNHARYDALFGQG